MSQNATTGKIVWVINAWKRNAQESQKTMEMLRKFSDTDQGIDPLPMELAPSAKRVDDLIRYAKETGAEAIAISAQRPSLFHRLFHASFTETLVHHADIPILVMNEHTKTVRHFHRILFPTDFSSASFEAFKTLLPTAARHGSTILLYYKFDYVLPETVRHLRSVPAYRKYLESDTVEHNVMGDRWSEHAQRHGVTTRLILDRHPGYVTDAILAAAARHRASLVAIASQRGSAAAAMLGSVTSDLMQRATCPLWVIHPHPTGTGNPRSALSA